MFQKFLKPEAAAGVIYNEVIAARHSSSIGAYLQGQV